MTNDTICAISTAPGVGGIAVARVSGPDALAVVSKIWQGADLAQAKSHTARLGAVLDIASQPPGVLDQAVATVYRAPRSFTGEDVVELSTHGSAYVQSQLLASLAAAGARLAEPGEFTRRAFASGKMDLAQAEAVADLIASETRAAHRIAANQMRGGFSLSLRQLRERLLTLASLLELELDFSEEDVEFASRQQLLDTALQAKAEVDRLAASFHAGSAIKNGIPVAIVGATNAGKSSLLNALLGDDRAIVSDIHGTTRDIVEDTLRIGDYSFRVMDTAGLRATSDAIETIGIERSLQAAAKADIVIAVVDASNPSPIDLPAEVDAPVILALNKIDLLSPAPSPASLAAKTDVNRSPVSSPAPSPATTSTLAENDIPTSGLVTIGSKDAANQQVNVSAKTGQGIDELRQAMAEIAEKAEGGQTSVLVTNARHHQALQQASTSLAAAIGAIEANLSGDLIAIDLRLSIDHLSSILGDITSSEILASIFSRFCIGK